MRTIWNLWKDEQGQDLIEYTLLLAFVALGIIGFMMGAGSSSAAVADEGSEVLSTANRNLNGS